MLHGSVSGNAATAKALAHQPQVVHPEAFLDPGDGGVPPAVGLVVSVESVREQGTEAAHHPALLPIDSSATLAPEWCGEKHRLVEPAGTVAPIGTDATGPGQERAATSTELTRGADGGLLPY
jgi:hypothetical protein